MVDLAQAQEKLLMAA
jgi:hypothetical protein